MNWKVHSPRHAFIFLTLFKDPDKAKEKKEVSDGALTENT
jgi:hypothetical protein